MMEDARNQLGQKLKQARRDAGLKQEHVAQYMAVSTSVVSALEGGQRKIDILELVALSTLYGRPLSWFLEAFLPASLPNTSQSGPPGWLEESPLAQDIFSRLENLSPEFRDRVLQAFWSFLAICP